MLTIIRLLKVFVCVGCMFCLTYCTRTEPESHLNQQKLTTPYTMPVSAYQAMAKSQTGSEKQALELMAAGRAIFEGQWRIGWSILQNIGPMSGELADEKNILLAKIDLIRNQPRQTITTLAAIKNPNQLSPFYQKQYHDMLAYAYQARGALVEAVVERIKLDYLLSDTVEQSNNRRALWLCLTKLSRPELDTLVAETNMNSVFRGWLALAAISRHTYPRPRAMMIDLAHWRTQYPHHPAQTFLPTALDKVEEHLFPTPTRMALLLPLTGPLAGPGKAIEDGFMAAFQASDRYHTASVRVYNTDAADAGQVYQRAVAEGADYIVGPLTKNEVNSVAKMAHPVPTLLLNESAHISDAMAFQFGLSPTHEAHQVASKAYKSGYSKALIIAPAGDWGNEVVRAFTTQWTAYHGQVVERWQYTPNSDLSVGIRTLLHASESVARVRPTKQTKDADNRDKRRQDFDVIILIAYPSMARQIMPLIRYYFAGDMPVYATSSVYSGIENTSKDRDLNGVIFCDMPWIFTHQLGEQHHWTEQLNSYNRLYALGMDSFTLSTQLNQLLLFPAIGISDQSGVVYMTKSHKLARILVFGQFRQGKAVVLNELTYK